GSPSASCARGAWPPCTTACTTRSPGSATPCRCSCSWPSFRLGPRCWVRSAGCASVGCNSSRRRSRSCGRSSCSRGTSIRSGSIPAGGRVGTPRAVLLLPPMVLVLKEPDLATSLSFFVFFVAMMFWAGLPLSTLFLALSPVLSIALFFLTRAEWPFAIVFVALLAWARPRLPVLLVLLVLNGAVMIGLPHLWNGLQPYQRGRIETFLNPDEDPTGAGYQVIQSQIAIGSGGPVGRGYLHGTQKALSFLPMKHTDFIFSVLGEELGFWGTSIALLLFAIVCYRGLWIAQTARN